MKSKLILNEEEDVIEIEKDESVLSDDSLAKSSLITSLIKATWDHIDLVKSISATLKDQGNDTSVIDDIVSQEYINIGLLEKELKTTDSQANLIFDERDAEDLPQQEESVVS